jgi:hypothetical protein
MELVAINVTAEIKILRRTTNFTHSCGKEV